MNNIKNLTDLTNHNIFGQTYQLIQSNQIEEPSIVINIGPKLINETIFLILPMRNPPPVVPVLVHTTSSDAKS